jgi:HAD superfamily hydrolase (TIGR01509 family)
VIRGLIFDFDGLILDTEGPIFHSWQTLYQAHGSQLALATWAEEVIGKAEGSFDLFDLLEEQIGQPVERTELNQQRRASEAELIARQPVMPGVHAYIKSARQLGLKTGLASSSSCRWVTGHLDRLGLLSSFDVIRAADDVSITKPDPALYLSVLAALELRPEQALAFEDSPNGVLSAKRAGLYCVAVPNELTRQLPLDQADLRLDSLTDLPLPNLLSIVSKNGH